MGQALAGWRFDARLYDRARRTSPRPGLHAGASTWLPALGQDYVRHVVLGKTLEALRLSRSALSFPSKSRLVREKFRARKFWLGCLDSNQDTQSQRRVIMCRILCKCDES